LKGFVREIFNY